MWSHCGSHKLFKQTTRYTLNLKLTAALAEIYHCLYSKLDLNNLETLLHIRKLLICQV